MNIFPTSLWVFTLLPLSALAIDQGIPAQPGEFPAVFKVHAEDFAKGAPTPGTAFLVHPKLLLTAAHVLNHSIRITSISNSHDTRSASKSGINARWGKYGFHPGYVDISTAHTQAQNVISAGFDIGYIVLKNEIAAIPPLPLHVVRRQDFKSHHSLTGRIATLVGYGATRFIPNGDYSFSQTSGKHWGKRWIDIANASVISLVGDEHAALPGDSGGPVIIEVDGTPQAVAINHSAVTDGKVVTTKKKNGRLKKKTVPVSGRTIATLLTEENLCWVERDSGIRFTSLDCESLGF